jgi:hypothetical protein
VKKIALTLAALFAGSLTAFAQSDGSKWATADQCYGAHMRLAGGDYPLAGDNPSELLDHCIRAVERGWCIFACAEPRLSVQQPE